MDEFLTSLTKHIEELVKLGKQLSNPSYVESLEQIGINLQS